MFMDSSYYFFSSFYWFMGLLFCGKHLYITQSCMMIENLKSMTCSLGL